MMMHWKPFYQQNILESWQRGLLPVQHSHNGKLRLSPSPDNKLGKYKSKSNLNHIHLQSNQSYPSSANYSILIYGRGLKESAGSLHCTSYGPELYTGPLAQRMEFMQRTLVFY